MQKILAIVVSLAISLGVTVPALAASPSQLQADFISAVNFQDGSGPLAASPETLNIALLHEGSKVVSYGGVSAYADADNKNHFSVIDLATLTAPNAPEAPFGVTFVEVHDLANVLAELGVETAVSTASNPRDIVLKAAIGSRWLIWRTGDSFVQTDQGKVTLPTEWRAAPGAAAGYSTTSFFPLRAVVMLLGGGISYIPGGGVVVQFAATTSTRAPFYLP